MNSRMLDPNQHVGTHYLPTAGEDAFIPLDHDQSYERNPEEQRNMGFFSVKPTLLSQIMIIDSPNLIQGLTMPNVYAAAFVDPTLMVSPAYDSDSRMSARIPYWAQGSEVDAQQAYGIQQLQAYLMGAP